VGCIFELFTHDPCQTRQLDPLGRCQRFLNLLVDQLESPSIQFGVPFGRTGTFFDGNLPNRLNYRFGVHAGLE